MLRIRVLGGISVERDGAPVTGAAAQPRRAAILAILARAGDRGVARERLLSLLWPDADEESGRSVLNQALYALRKDLGASESIAGLHSLRFEPAYVTCDVAEFEGALAAGDRERAVEVWGGPFLDSFRLPGAPEFERWVETEREVLARRYAEALERLARDASERGDWLVAIRWWRRVAALDPLNARVTLDLMRALAAAGDRAGALQQARIYEALLDEELDLPPDRDVVDFARALRDEPGRAAAAATSAPSSESHGVTVDPAGENVRPDAGERRQAERRRGDRSTADRRRSPERPSVRWSRLLPVAGILAVVITAIALNARSAPADAPNVLAIGRITDYRAGDDAAAPLADMLATNLARARPLRVISSARMLEMLARATEEGDTTSRYLRAARMAGAGEVIEGTVTELEGGGYRLDLRRIDLASGTILDAQTVRGRDLFGLADSGSVRLLGSLGDAPLPGPIADVTTRSLVAYRLYAQGIRRFQSGDAPAARALFDDALAEDSTFAMAAYWSSVAIGFDWRSPERRDMLARLDRALRLSDRASDRERLIIRTYWARATQSPALRAIADSLSARYPEELDGHVQAGAAAIAAGDFAGAVAPLETAIRLDSLVLASGAERCGGCTAVDLLIRAYVAADSMDAAERVARRALRTWSGSVIPWVLLAEVLDYQGRYAEAEEAIRAASALRPESTVNAYARHWIRTGQFDRLDAMLGERTASGGQQVGLLFWSTFSLRNQGRFEEALAAARAFRTATAERGDSPASAPTSASIEAQVLLESGQPRRAALLFDSIADWYVDAQPEASRASNVAWHLAQAAGAWAAAGDTAAVRASATRIEDAGMRTYLERDHRLHHYARGLDAALHADDARAIAEFREANYSTTIGFNRINYELAKLYLAEHRPADAIAILRPAARGAVLEGANLNLRLADVHALMAQAFADAGQPDSARVHARWGGGE